MAVVNAGDETRDETVSYWALRLYPVASLGWVSPRATTAVSPLFILLITVNFIDISLGCHHAPFLPVRPRLSTILYKFAHIFFTSGVTPWRVSPAGAVRPRPPR